LQTVLVVDNLSPFTPDILACLDRLGVDYVCKKYSEISDLSEYSRVILSGRRKNDSATNAANARIIRHCFEDSLPVLGICYGAEIIAMTLGGSLRRMPQAVQGPTKILPSGPNLLTGDKKSVMMYESHRLCIARLPDGFDLLASSDHCRYEIFSHKTKKICGTQFHPEKSGQDGLDLIESFLRL
jgi:GMP synthase (glutamine-hydrolysing)